MAGKNDVVERLLDTAYELREAKEKLGEKVKANREALRTMAAADVLTDEQAKELAELYPPRERKTDGDAPAAEGAAAPAGATA